MSEIITQANTVASIPRPGPKGLGGWLVLPIIGLFFDGLSCLFSLGSTILLDIMNINPRYTPQSGYLIAYSVVANILQLSISIILLVLTFRKNRSARALYIVYYAVYAFIVFLGLLLNPTLPSNDEISKMIAVLGAVVGVVLGVVVPAIWIPYFIRSKRVKNTFLNLSVEPETPVDAPVLETPYDPSNPYGYNPGETKIQ